LILSLAPTASSLKARTANSSSATSACRFFGSFAASRLAALCCAAFGSSRERLMRSCGAALAAKSIQGSAGSFLRFLLLRMLARRSVLGRFLANCRCTLWGSQFHTRPSSLRKADGNCLFRGTGSVLSLTNMVNFLPNKLSRLGRRGLALFGIFLRASNGLLFWHVLKGLLDPLAHSIEPRPRNQQYEVNRRLVNSSEAARTILASTFSMPIFHAQSNCFGTVQLLR